MSAAAFIKDSKRVQATLFFFLFVITKTEAVERLIVRGHSGNSQEEGSVPGFQ